MTRRTTTLPVAPAFWAICRRGAVRALRMILTPAAWSPSRPRLGPPPFLPPLRAVMALLLVVVAGRDLDLAADLLNPALNRLGVAGAFDNRGVVVVDADLLRPPELGDLDLV